jgi:hypothetical protein
MDASSNAMRIETVESHQHEMVLPFEQFSVSGEPVLLPWLFSEITVRKHGNNIAFQVGDSFAIPERFRCQLTVSVDEATKTFQPNTVVWNHVPDKFADAHKQKAIQPIIAHLEKIYKDNLPAFIEELNKPISGMKESALLGLLQDHEPLLMEAKSKNFFAIGMLTMGFAGVGAVVGALCFPKKMDVV